jgi:Holliday junction resolvase RusA-like endonuclease
MNLWAEKKGEALAEIILFSRAVPQSRSRKGKKKVYTDLQDQADILNQMSAYSGLKIDQPILIEVELGYTDFYVGGKLLNYDNDNIEKALFDHMQRCHIISNDKIIVGNMTIKHREVEDRVTIRIFEAKNL